MQCLVAAFDLPSVEECSVRVSFLLGDSYRTFDHDQNMESDYARKLVELVPTVEKDRILLLTL